MLTGAEFAAVRDAIVQAFGPDEFDMFLSERLEFERSNEIADGPFRLVVSNVLKAAVQQGWDAALIAEVAAARPLKRDVQEVYENFAYLLVDEARRQVIDAARLRAVARFGLGAAITLQKAGKAQLPIASITDSGLERLVRQELPFLDIGLWREQIFKVEGHVCRVEIQGHPRGTGFLVGPDVLLTNYHVLADVIESRVAASEVKLRFDFRVLPTGLRSQGTITALHATDWLVSASKGAPGEASKDPDSVLPTIDELDYALVRLDGPFGDELYHTSGADGSKRGWIEIPAAAPAIEIGMPILIVQHPNAAPLRLAMDTSGVQSVNANKTRIRYNTNTEPGSSGSPCFDIHWGLIALHHLGDAQHDRAQFNQGIPISAIRERLEREGKATVLGGHS